MTAKSHTVTALECKALPGEDVQPDIFVKMKPPKYPLIKQMICNKDTESSKDTKASQYIASCRQRG